MISLLPLNPTAHDIRLDLLFSRILRSTLLCRSLISWQMMLQFTKPRKLSIVRIRSPHHLFEEKHFLLTPQGPTLFPSRRYVCLSECLPALGLHLEKTWPTVSSGFLSLTFSNPGQLLAQSPSRFQNCSTADLIKRVWPSSSRSVKMGWTLNP